MNFGKWSTAIGVDINRINKQYDDAIFNKAKNWRKEIAIVLLSSADETWKNIDLHGSIMESILERTPFDNTADILKFNSAITDRVCEEILKSDTYSLFEKIGIYASAIELGSREFISPNNTNKVYNHLGAAKDAGYFFTPPSLAIRMVITSIEQFPKAKVILDPATGAGVFLAYHILINKEINSVIGIEIDPKTAELAKKLLIYISAYIDRSIDIKVVCANFFDYFDKVRGSLHVDSIIMNPPYGSVKFLASDLTDVSTKANISREQITDLGNKIRLQTINYSARLRKQFYGTGMGTGTLEYSKLFMTAAFDLITQHGIIVAVTPSSWLGDETSTTFRKNVISNGWIKELWIIPEKAKMFKGVNQPTVVSVFEKANFPIISISNPVLKVEDIEKIHFSFNLKSILAVSGDKLTFPKCNEADLKILVKFQRFGKIKDYTDMFHEFGHFVNAFYTQSDLIFGAPDNDLAELQSQGMEMMFACFFDDIFGSEYGDAVRDDELLNLVYSVVDGAMYDEFQRRCYEEESLTGERACQIYSEVYREYGYQPHDGYEYEWINVAHNFEHPFYYISYAVSALSALELYGQLQTDWESAADRYMTVSAMDCEAYYFSEALKEAGLSDVFDPQVCAAAAAQLEKGFK